MYIENRGQHPSLNTIYQLVTLLEISVDQSFYPGSESGTSDCRRHIDVLLSTMDEISHRLSSCKFCDEIALFHDGAVIQQGIHDELLADENGKYHQFCNAQAQYYTE